MKKLAVLIVIFVLLLSLIPTGSVAFADDQVYSDVLADLQKDENFDANAYSVDLGNNSIDIITLARGEYDELYVYTYQPAIQRAFYCSSINISRHNPDDSEAIVSYDNYRLSFCNKNGVFYKYIVEGFTVLDDNIRYYCISQIMRPFDASVDEQPGNGQTVSEVPVKNGGSPVSKEFVFHEIDGQTLVECKDLTVVEITSMFVGYVRYYNGGIFHGPNDETHSDSHLVAFSTNWQIDELFDVDVKWKYSSWSYLYDDAFGDSEENRFSESIGAPVEHSIVTLHAEVLHEQSSNRLFADRYEFNEIQTVAELLEEENVEIVYDGALVKVSQNTQFTSEARSALSDKQWVIRFAMTPYYETVGQAEGTHWVDATRVTEVMILRLHFKSQGQEYNLGTVSNRQTGSSDPIGQTNTVIDLQEDLKDLLLWLIIILGLIALCVLLNFLSPVLKGICWFITLPFKAIKRLVGKGSNKPTEQPQRKPSKYRYRR